MYGNVGNPQSTKPSNRGTGWGPRRDLPEKFDPASGKTICQKFNGRAGCPWPACRFAHVCMTCYGRRHGDSYHRDSSKNQ